MTDKVSFPHYECPIASKAITLPCTVRSCMYHDDGATIKGCRYAKVHEALHKDTLPKEVKKRTVCQLFTIEEDDLAVAIRRVMNTLCVSEYFNYVYEKSILDARPKEFAALAESEERYNAWRPSAKKIAFSDLIATLEFLKNNLT